MKQLFILLGILLAANCTQAQKWQHTIGTPGGSEDGRQVIEHYDHGYLVTGSRSNGNDNYRGWLIKTDINGQELWDKELGIPPDQVLINKTIYDAQGNIYVFGTIIQNTQNPWLLVVKLNSCGEKVWCRNLANNDFFYGYFTDAILLENGDLLGLAYYPDEEQYDIIFLFCISSDGEYKWKKSYASKANYPYFANRFGQAVEKFGDTYVISGYVYSPYPGGDPYHVWLRPMFIGIDEAFNEKWVVQFGINDSLLGKAYNTIRINDSLLMGVGTNRRVDNGVISDNTFLMFYNSNGEEIKHHTILGSEISPDIQQNFIFDIERINETKFLCAAAIGEENMGSPMGEMVIDTAGNVYNYVFHENSGGGQLYGQNL